MKWMLRRFEISVDSKWTEETGDDIRHQQRSFYIHQLHRCSSSLWNLDLWWLLITQVVWHLLAIDYCPSPHPSHLVISIGSVADLLRSPTKCSILHPRHVRQDQRKEWGDTHQKISVINFIKLKCVQGRALVIGIADRNTRHPRLDLHPIQDKAALLSNCSMCMFKKNHSIPYSIPSWPASQFICHLRLPSPRLPFFWPLLQWKKKRKREKEKKKTDWLLWIDMTLADVGWSRSVMMMVVVVE